MGRFQLAVIAFALFATALFFGCTQPTMPSSCSGVNQDRLANCIYASAVLDQNPYSCYSLSVLSQREKCLTDSTDSAVKSRFELMSPQERARVFAAGSDLMVAPPMPPPNIVPTAPANNPQGPVPQGNPQSGVSEEDAQAYMQAVNSNDLAPCVAIVDKSTRESCISQVAQKIKNPDACPMFTIKTDFDLCNMYAKAS